MTEAGKRLVAWTDGATDYHAADCDALLGDVCSCDLPKAIAAIEAEAVAARNAEIVEAVLGLTGGYDPDGREYVDLISRAAVLAIIEKP